MNSIEKTIDGLDICITYPKSLDEPEIIEQSKKDEDIKKEKEKEDSDNEDNNDSENADEAGKEQDDDVDDDDSDSNCDKNKDVKNTDDKIKDKHIEQKKQDNSPEQQVKIKKDEPLETRKEKEKEKEIHPPKMSPSVSIKIYGNNRIYDSTIEGDQLKTMHDLFKFGGFRMLLTLLKEFFESPKPMIEIDMKNIIFKVRTKVSNMETVIPIVIPFKNVKDEDIMTMELRRLTKRLTATELLLAKIMKKINLDEVEKEKETEQEPEKEKKDNKPKRGRKAKN